MFLEHHPAAVCGADAPVEKAVKVDCNMWSDKKRDDKPFQPPPNFSASS